MKLQLNELRKIKADNCVTIILNTHRTHPDSEKDPIVLKNLVAEAAERLQENEDKKVAANLIERIEILANAVNHQQNQESLILFVNEEVAEYIRLPVAVTNRVIVDNRFAIRDLVRAVNAQTNYLILVLNKDETRLIEAFNDKDVQEFGAPFPIVNADHSKTFSRQARETNRQGELISEYFNYVDKQVNEIRKQYPLPVLICSEEENYYEYLKIADQKDSIIDSYLNRSRQTEKAHAIVRDAWEIVQEIFKNKNDARKAELQQAVSSNKFLSDTNDIRMAIGEGRVGTLFIEEGLYQPAVIENDRVVYQENNDSRGGVIDDIYDELIEMNINYGGDVVFLPPGELRKFNGFGAITRY